jgi:hypothetical protein
MCKSNAKVVQAKDLILLLNRQGFIIGMHRILFSPNIRLAGYPVNLKAGYRISGKGRIPDIGPDTGYPAGYLPCQLYFW